MSKKEKLKTWYEKHKREIRDAAWYMAGAAMAIGGIYVAGRLDEMKYDGYNVKTSLMEKNGEYGISYARTLKNGKPDFDTGRFLAWPKDEAKEVAEELLKLTTKDKTKES